MGHAVKVRCEICHIMRSISKRPIEDRIASAHCFLRSVSPPLTSICFGLLHGLSFAGALAEIGLPHGEIPLALFAFNVGVELGQLGFVAVILSAAYLTRILLADVPS